MSRYTISTTDGRQDRALRTAYDTQEDAAAAIQTLMGWETIVLSLSYSVDGGDAVSAYETEAECEADETGADAPRITREKDEATENACEECGKDLDGACECAFEAEPDCVDDHEHEWLGNGGDSKNPGYWSLGGTASKTREVCEHCGAIRRTTAYGSQRNPDQMDERTYEVRTPVIV